MSKDAFQRLLGLPDELAPMDSIKNSDEQAEYIQKLVTFAQKVCQPIQSYIRAVENEPNDPPTREYIEHLSMAKNRLDILQLTLEQIEAEMGRLSHDHVLFPELNTDITTLFRTRELYAQKIDQLSTYLPPISESFFSWTIIKQWVREAIVSIGLVTRL